MEHTNTPLPPPADIAAALRAALTLAEPLLRALPDADAAQRPKPGKWSAREILGHLVDSAGNNQQKFVRTMAADPHIGFTGYAQDTWVALQQYQSAPWPQVIDLWAAINRHLAHVIDHAPAHTLNHTISIDGAGPFSLHFIMADYVEHLKHHLLQIFPEAPLESRFLNVYGT